MDQQILSFINCNKIPLGTDTIIICEIAQTFIILSVHDSFIYQMYYISIYILDFFDFLTKIIINDFVTQKIACVILFYCKTNLLLCANSEIHFWRTIIFYRLTMFQYSLDFHLSFFPLSLKPFLD